jgi:beta-galactosidase
LFQEINSRGLRSVIEEYSVYGLPIVITENGLADSSDGRRPFFLIDHIRTVGQAIADGYDVRGYYCWTISDNFEWQVGTNARFGLYYVDYRKSGFPRIATHSADVYKEIATKRLIDRKMWDTLASVEYREGSVPAF